MDVAGIVGIGIVGAAMAVLLKQYKPEYALAVSLAVGVLIFVVAMENLGPVLDELEALLDATAMPGEYIGVLVKSLGVCFLTQIACDTCRDAGQSAIASKLEIAGKLAILVLSLPLFSDLLAIVTGLLSA